MKFLALLIILLNSNFGFSQKKIEYNIGIKYRITPIYMEPIQGIYFSEKNILIQQDKHLSGKSLINDFAYTFFNFKISYTLGARIDLAESKLEGLYISNARNKLFIDHIFTFHKLFLKNTKKEFSIGLGCGLNNFNSDYTYTKINRDNIGQITSVSHGNSDYQFSTFNFGVEKKYKKLMYGIGMEYVFGHNFLEPSMFIMPNIIIKYKLNNLLKKQ